MASSTTVSALHRLTRRCNRRAATLISAHRRVAERRPAAERQVVSQAESVESQQVNVRQSRTAADLRIVPFLES
jgi:hypothetical protein